MTEFDLKKKLENHFMTLNEFSTIPFLNESNVNKGDNKAFFVPADKRWFSLAFLSDTPDEIGIGNNEQERITGIYQIDVCVPIDKGEDEAESKYKWIKKLFKTGLEIDEITINKVYKASASTEKNYYRVVVRVEWTADIVVD